MKLFENLNFNSFFGKKKIDENLLNKFEDLLIQSDVGTEIALDLKEKFKKEKIGKEIKDEREVFNQIREQLEDAGLTVQEQIDLHGLEDNHCLYYVTN